MLTVALHADTQPSNAPILDACFLDLDKMISTPHSSHKQHAVQLKLPLSLQWYELAPNKAGTRRELVIPSGASVMTGHATAAFQKKILKGESLPRADLCFSLVVPTRTLDLAVETAHEAQAWVASLQYLVRLADSLSRKEEVPNEFPDSRPSVIASIPATLQHLLQANSAIGITGEPIPVNSSHSSSRASAEARHAISMQLGHPGYTSQPTPTPDVLGTSHASDSPPRSPLAAGASPKSSGTIFNGSGKQSGTVGMAALNRVVEGPLQMRGTWKDRLFSAARNGDIDVFEAVLAGGAPVDTPIGTDMNTLASQSSGSLGLGGNHKWDTPLIVAARQGCINIITVCLKAGAKNDPFGQGTTALHAAVGARQYEAATVLLQSAALAGAASTICEILDSSGNSPLHLAAGLLSGADAAVGGSDDGLRLIELLIGYGASLKQRDAQGRTCLHLAAAAVHAAAIELMLEYDDELINLVDNAGNAALHIVVIKNDIACARVLLQSAANPYLKSAQYGKNALNLAISKGFTNLGVLLLEYKTYVDDNGNTEFVDPDNMSRVGSIKQVASQSYHIADPTTSVEEEPHVEATYDVPAAEFFVREQHWRMYMWREEGSADAPYFVDANGDSTWDDPRDFVEMADENISAQVVREEPTEPSSQAENELQPELPTMLPVMSSAPINDRTNYSGPDVVTWIYGEPDEVVPVYAQYPAQSSIDGPPEFYLRKRRLSDAEAYFAAIDASREHLNRTIPSRAVPETLLAAQEMIASSLDQWVKRTAFQYFIWEPVLDAEVIASSGLLRGQEQLVGSIALFNRNSPNTLEVGFWVSASHCRRGLASRATLALMLMAFETFSKPQRGLSNYEPPVMRTTQDSDLQMIELYHDKLLERQSGGVARKIGFLREEEKEYEPAVTKAPTSGLMVRWAYPVDRLTRLKMLKIGSKVKN